MSLANDKKAQLIHVQGWTPATYGVLGCCAILGFAGFLHDQYTHLVEEEAKAKVKEVFAKEEERARQSGISMLMATVNTTQKLTRQALIEAGWVASDWAVRPDTSSYETRVSVLHKFVNTSEKESKV